MLASATANLLVALVIHRNAWSSRSGRRRRPRLQVWVG
ncbi:hypothetical protein I553_3983 [Mycobacterium xenopi 4042]|uniref:Uncharacterized protein n=1 Tax=Mycobacterium xenopi 4042 TaxID=1299334 RepID=X8DC68_MYCXE|nr:hypothetical protein I553_3983 [Mycobacterium xenopi 4042]